MKVGASAQAVSHGFPVLKTRREH